MPHDTLTELELGRVEQSVRHAYRDGFGTVSLEPDTVRRLCEEVRELRNDAALRQAVKVEAT